MYVEMDDPILMKPKKWIIEQKHLNCYLTYPYPILQRQTNIGKNNKEDSAKTCHEFSSLSAVGEWSLNVWEVYQWQLFVSGN